MSSKAQIEIINQHNFIKTLQEEIKKKDKHIENLESMGFPLCMAERDNTIINQQQTIRDLQKELDEEKKCIKKFTTELPPVSKFAEDVIRDLRKELEEKNKSIKNLNDERIKYAKEEMKDIIDNEETQRNEFLIFVGKKTFKTHEYTFTLREGGAVTATFSETPKSTSFDFEYALYHDDDGPYYEKIDDYLIPEECAEFWGEVARIKGQLEQELRKERGIDENTAR